MERTRSRRRLYAVLTTMALMLSAFAGISVADSDTDDNGKHCKDHRDNPKVEAEGDPAEADETITVDGQEVRVVIDGDTVNFFDDAGNPISVEFCISASQQNSGPQEGHEGHVTWTNRGGNTPDISYVVVYGIVDDEPDECPANLLLTQEHDTNELGESHTVTATVTDGEGNPCDDITVLFEVDPAETADPSSHTDTTGEDGTATFTYDTLRTEPGTDTITACTTEDGEAPASCDDAEVHASDSIEKHWVEPEGDAFCRQQTVYLFDGELVLFQANEDGEPCVTEDGSLLNEDQLRLVRSETDEDDTSATGEAVGLGGPGDPGSISVIGTRTDCDEQEAYILSLSADGEEQFRLAGEGDPLPDLAMDDENGIFATRTTSGGDGKGGTAEAVAVTIQGTDLVVLSKAESRC